MKIIQFLIIVMIMITASATRADSITILDTPAGVYDRVYARLAVAQSTGRAYVQVFLVEEAYYSACWGDQAVMRGIGNDECLINTRNVIVPGLAYNQAQNGFTYNGNPINEKNLLTDLYYQQVDTGIRMNSVRYVQVKLQIP